MYLPSSLAGRMLKIHLEKVAETGGSPSQVISITKGQILASFGRPRLLLPGKFAGDANMSSTL